MKIINEKNIIPTEDKLSSDNPNYEEIIEKHKKAIENDKDTYDDPQTGYTVFTAKFLLDRGYCCNSGCRHCPYE